MRVPADHRTSELCPDIIDRPELKSKRRLIFETAITFCLWCAYLHCLLPVAGVIVPGLSERLPGGEVTLGHFRVRLADLPGYGLLAAPPSMLAHLLTVTGNIALAVVLLYLLWVCYNGIAALMRPGGRTGRRCAYRVGPRTARIKRRRAAGTLISLAAACVIFVWAFTRANFMPEQGRVKAGQGPVPGPARMAEEEAMIAALRPAALWGANAAGAAAGAGRAAWPGRAPLWGPFAGGAVLTGPLAVSLMRTAGTGPAALSMVAKEAAPKRAAVAGLRAAGAGAAKHVVRHAKKKHVKKIHGNGARPRKGDMLLKMALAKWDMLLPR